MRKHLNEVVDYANELRRLWADDGAVSAVAMVNYLGDFIMRWSMEAEYKLARWLMQAPSDTSFVKKTIAP